MNSRSRDPRSRCIAWINYLMWPLNFVLNIATINKYKHIQASHSPNLDCADGENWKYALVNIPVWCQHCIIADQGWIAFCLVLRSFLRFGWWARNNWLMEFGGLYVCWLKMSYWDRLLVCNPLDYLITSSQTFHVLIVHCECTMGRKITTLNLCYVS